MTVLVNYGQVGADSVFDVQRRKTTDRIPLLSHVKPESTCTLGHKSNGKGPGFEIRPASHLSGGMSWTVTNLTKPHVSSVNQRL